MTEQILETSVLGFFLFFSFRDVRSRPFGALDVKTSLQTKAYLNSEILPENILRKAGNETLRAMRL